MFEIEIRAKIDNIEKVKERIESLGAKHIKTEEQVDRIFGRTCDVGVDHKIIEGCFSARVRQTLDKVFVQLKEIRRKGAGLEFSSQVSKIEDGLYLLEKIGFTEAFKISKKRILYTLKGYEIYLDDVENLGSYIEIEHYDKSGKDQEKRGKELKDLLLLIDPNTQIERKKYGDLIQDRINQKQEKTNFKDLVDLFQKAEKLKSIKRFKANTLMKERESSADHAWKVSFLLLSVIKNIDLQIDFLKALKMAIVHNFYEIYSDNIDFVILIKNNASLKEKEEKERKALEEINKLLPGINAKELHDLLLEFKERKTREAKLVKALSKIETLDHLLNCGYQTYDNPDLIANYADEYVKEFPEIKPLLQEIKKRLKEEFQKGNLVWKDEHNSII